MKLMVNSNSIDSINSINDNSMWAICLYKILFQKTEYVINAVEDDDMTILYKNNDEKLTKNTETIGEIDKSMPN